MCITYVWQFLFVFIFLQREAIVDIFVASFARIEIIAANNFSTLTSQALGKASI